MEIVAVGLSSMIQWPESGITPSRTLRTANLNFGYRSRTNRAPELIQQGVHLFERPAFIAKRDGR
jgi:hypothetical protein